MIEQMGCSALVEMTDMCVDKYLQNLCRIKKINYFDVITNIKLPRKTFLMQYYDEVKSLKKEDIRKFVQKYSWVGTHALEGEPLTAANIEYFKDQKEVSATKFNIPSEFISIVDIASGLSFYRGQSMDVINKVAFSYRPYFIKLAKKYNFSYNDIISLTHREILELIDNDIVPQGIKNRKKHFGVIMFNNNTEIILGDKLKKELDKHKKEINIDTNRVLGTPAFKGKVRGVAKILTEVEHAYKVKKGDILIAQETTPDYIMAMRKAVAFVTDIGGLTCHAAISAREMKKPCVIATKYATKIFKDGDMVEVDANQGIVKKIN